MNGAELQYLTQPMNKCGAVDTEQSCFFNLIQPPERTQPNVIDKNGRLVTAPCATVLGGLSVVLLAVGIAAQLLI